MIILPVIHYRDQEQARRNADIVAASGARGLFMISMEGDDAGALSAARHAKNNHPSLHIGFNGLSMSPMEACRASRDAGLDMTWSDSPGVTSLSVNDEAWDVADIIGGTRHQFFASIAFKYQPHEANPGAAATRAAELGFIPTTSGTATGRAPDVEKLRRIREVYPTGPLAVASGVTSENVGMFLQVIDHVLVFTGISQNDVDIDPEKLRILIEKSQM